VVAVAVALLLHPLRRQLEEEVVAGDLDGVVATILVAGVAILAAGATLVAGVVAAVAAQPLHPLRRQLEVVVEEVSEQSCTTELLKELVGKNSCECDGSFDSFSLRCARCNATYIITFETE